MTVCKNDKRNQIQGYSIIETFHNIDILQLLHNIYIEKIGKIGKIMNLKYQLI